jgi:hypothetical protein
MGYGLAELARLAAAERAELLVGEGPADPLRAVSALRRDRPDLSPDLASAVIAQRGYQSRAAAIGALPAGGPWLTTEVGLEQSTRPAVAERRAATLASAGVASVVDATAGIGMDARACLHAGLQVVALERDEVTSAVCRANLDLAAERSGVQVRVQCADATLPGAIAEAAGSLPAPVAVFVDPARRGASRPVDGTRSRSERDRNLWSPPWSFIEGLRDAFDYVAVKAPPGLVPDARWKAEWIAVADTVVECALYSPAACRNEARRATILNTASLWSMAFGMDASRPPAGGLRDFLAEVHPVARRTGVIARLCTDAPGLAPVTNSSMWMSNQLPVPHGVPLRWFEVLGSTTLRGISHLCRDHGIDRVALKTREATRRQTEIRARIDLPDGDEFAIVAIADLPDYVLVRRMPQM